jgi:hypothetical protein
MGYARVILFTVVIAAIVGASWLLATSFWGKGGGRR